MKASEKQEFIRTAIHIKIRKMLKQKNDKNMQNLRNEKSILTEKHKQELKETQNEAEKRLSCE